MTWDGRGHPAPQRQPEVSVGFQVDPGLGFLGSSSPVSFHLPLPPFLATVSSSLTNSCSFAPGRSLLLQLILDFAPGIIFLHGEVAPVTCVRSALHPHPKLFLTDSCLTSDVASDMPHAQHCLPAPKPAPPSPASAPFVGAS